MDAELTIFDMIILLSDTLGLQLGISFGFILHKINR